MSSSDSRAVKTAALAFALAGTSLGLALASASFYSTYYATPKPKKLSHGTWYDAVDDDGRVKSLTAVREEVIAGGIPSSLRAEVWSVLLGLRDPSSTSVEFEQGKRTRRELYETYRRRCSELVELLSKPVQGSVANLPSDLASFTEASRIIAADAPRTMLSYGTFARDWESGILSSEDESTRIDWRIEQRNRLIRVLESYAILDPVIGYTQGMNDLAAHFVRDISNESEAFWCFAKFMGASYRCHFLINPHESVRSERAQEGVSDRLRALSEIIKTVDAPLHKHLKFLNAQECMFAFRPVVVLMARELEAAEVGLLWDMLIAAEDNEATSKRKSVGGGARLFLHVVAAALVKMRTQIMTCKKSDELMQLMARKLPSKRFQAHELVKKARELMNMTNGLGEAIVVTSRAELALRRAEST